MNIKKLTLASLLTAIGAASAHIISIPIGVSMVFPVQHSINILAAVILGPGPAVAVAFAISLIRNIMGTGSPLAFPGSMIGAFLGGLLFKKTQKHFFAMLGEILGTGIIGGLVAYPVARHLMGREVAALFFVAPFLISSSAGALIGYLLFTIFFKIGIKNPLDM